MTNKQAALIAATLAAKANTVEDEAITFARAERFQAWLGDEPDHEAKPPAPRPSVPVQAQSNRPGRSR